MVYTCKIEKVPRCIRGEKSSKDMASSRNLVSTIGAQVPQSGTDFFNVSPFDYTAFAVSWKVGLP